MAKLAKKVTTDDSDTDGEEEFPALEVLLRRPVDSGVPSKTLTIKLSERKENSEKRKENCRMGALESERKVEGVKEVKKMVKRRVLNQTSDNPLLQRLGTKKEKTGESAQASDSLDAELKSRARIIGADKNARKQAFAAYLDAEREEQGVRSKGKVPRNITPPTFTVGDKKEAVKPGGKAVGKGREATRESTPVEVDEEDLKPKGKATRERKGREPTLMFVQDDEEDLKPRRKAARDKKVVEYAPVPNLDEEWYGHGPEANDDYLSDFVVNDSDEESVMETQPPRSVRRLIKGRRTEKEDEDLEAKMRSLNVDDDSADPFRDSLRDTRRFSEEASFDTERTTKPRDQPKPVKKHIGTKQYLQTSPDIEEPYTLRFSPPTNKPIKVFKETRFTTPPGSPEIKPRALSSPTKITQIPATPHRPSMDSFWCPDVVNDWNDQYSPQKTPKPPPKPLFSPEKSPAKQDRITKVAKKSFARYKHEIASSFLKELDETITDGEIAKLAESTGGVKIIWSKKLNTTAGRANWKRETMRTTTLGADGKPQPTYRHHATIELAEKVIDDENRLLNVMAHEFCHLANYMVSNIKTNPHGKEFKAWAAKCGKVFGRRGVEVTTKHSYEIEYKYIWVCQDCSMEFGRHSKSIDPKRHRCGACKGKLVQIKPRLRKEAEGGPKGLGDYQIFVKDNMAAVRKENPGSPQKEIMGLVGKKYKEYKASKLLESVSVVDVSIKEGTPDVEIEIEIETQTAVRRKLDFLETQKVVRKLDCLDLTSD